MRTVRMPQARRSSPGQLTATLPWMRTGAGPQTAETDAPRLNRGASILAKAIQQILCQFKAGIFLFLFMDLAAVAFALSRSAAASECNERKSFRQADIWPSASARCDRSRYALCRARFLHQRGTSGGFATQPAPFEPAFTISQETSEPEAMPAGSSSSGHRCELVGAHQ